MLLCQKLSHLFCILLHLDFRQAYTDEDFRLFDFHDTFINEYLRYRTELGCRAPLCSEILEQNRTYPDGGSARNAFQDYPVTMSPNLSLMDLNNSSNANSTHCCSTCSCSDDCLRYGNCCPDKLTKDFIVSSIYPIGGIFDCGTSGVRPERDISKEKFKLINKCIRTFDHKDTIEGCTTPAAMKLKNYRIVSHKTTQEAYKNIYCARCNNVKDEDVVEWPTKIKCRQGIFLPQNMSEIVTEIRQSNHCDVVFDRPEGIRAKYCEPPIAKCNETGLLRTKDNLVLEKACNAFVSEFRSGKETYRNTFCYLCNAGDTNEHECASHKREESGYRHFPELKLSFAALLDFTESAPVIEASDCGFNYVYDIFKGICRKILCSPLTILYNGICKRVVHSISGLTFEATIQLTPSVDSGGNDDNTLRQQLEDYFENIAENCTTNVTITLQTDNSSSARNFHRGINMSHIGVFVVFIKFKDDVDFADRLIGLDDSVIAIPSLDFNPQELEDTYGAKHPIKYSVSKRQLAKFSTELDLPLSAHQTINLEGTAVVSKFLKCEMIELNLDTFDIRRQEAGIFLAELSLFLSRNDYMETNLNQIRVCARDYIPSTKNLDRPSRPSLINILSITCACLSFISLIITLIVYSVFTELRTQPGLNNMSLSVSLLAAITGLFIGGIRSIDGFWCSLVGLLVHFLWLNSVFWLNICCFHMFRTFGTIRLPVKKKTSWMYHVYGLIGSTVLININIIWSLSVSNGTISGYGKHASVCYIYYPHMVGYTMALPVGLIVVTNIIMYITVIYKIKKDSFSVSCQRSQKHFSIYVKLSTVTGISWLSYIPAILSRSHVCDVIFSVLVACQGVYIMFAFVCNRRVLNLFKTFIKERQEHASKSADIRGKVTQDKASNASKEKDTTTTLV